MLTYDVIILMSVFARVFIFLQEKVALVELMCDFVEAMNPGLKLAR